MLEQLLKTEAYLYLKRYLPVFWVGKFLPPGFGADKKIDIASSSDLGIYNAHAPDLLQVHFNMVAASPVLQ